MLELYIFLISCLAYAFGMVLGANPCFGAFVVAEIEVDMSEFVINVCVSYKLLLSNGQDVKLAVSSEQITEARANCDHPPSSYATFSKLL